jgi:hypothetical protein
MNLAAIYWAGWAIAGCIIILYSQTRRSRQPFLQLLLGAVMVLVGSFFFWQVYGS